VIVLVQYAASVPGDWKEIDSAQWNAEPKRPIPAGGESPDPPGYVNAINIGGEVWQGFDHYRIEDIADAEQGAGVRLTAWDTDAEDYPAGRRHARQAIYFDHAPDPQMNGAITARSAHTVWAEPDIFAEMAPFYPGGSGTDLIEVGDLGTDWPAPADDDATRHGLILTDPDFAAHAAALSVQGWRSARWCAHLAADELKADGTLKSQREQGRYVPLDHTRTYYHTATPQAYPPAAADYANLLSLTTAAATSQSTTTSAAGALGWAATTPANEPASAAWPTGTYRAQIDVVSIDVNVVVGAHFVRLDSALAAELEAIPQAQPAFNGTGLHLGQYLGAWTPGAVGDRFGVKLLIDRVGGMGQQSIELELGELDDFADGDWPAAAPAVSSIRSTVTASAAISSGVTMQEAIEVQTVTVLEA